MKIGLYLREAIKSPACLVSLGRQMLNRSPDTCSSKKDPLQSAISRGIWASLREYRIAPIEGRDSLVDGEFVKGHGDREVENDDFPYEPDENTS
jgi:hypothetical protein